MTNERSHMVVLCACVLAAAAGTGVVVASISWQLSLAVVSAGAGVFALAFLRVVVRPDEALGAVHPRVAQDESATAHSRFRLARLVYYLGAVTIGLLTVRPALGFTLSDWIFLASLALVVLALLTRGLAPKFEVPSLVAVGVVIFAVGGLISSAHAVEPSASGLVIVRMLYLTLVWFWLGTLVLETRGHVRTAMGAWVLSAALGSTGAVAQFFYGDVIPGGTVAWGRMSGFAEHFNQLGGLTATAFVPALMLAVDSRQRWTRTLGTASTALIATGLLLSGSVGGLLAASAGTLVWFALRGVSVRIVVSLAVVVASGFLLMSATGSTDAPSPVQRVLRVTSAERAEEGTGGTLYTRVETWADAWARIAEQPLVGIGLDGASAEAALEGRTVHNMVLSLWLTAGVLGLVGIVMIVAGALASGMRVLRSASHADRSLVAALLAALVGFAVFSMGEPILFVRYGWFPSALLIALLAQKNRARSRQPSKVGRHGAAYPLAAATR